MKVFIGSIIVVGLLCVGIWLLLSPTYKKVGNAAKKYNKFWEDEKHNGRNHTRKDDREKES
jgi:hypothetical protein